MGGAVFRFTRYGCAKSPMKGIELWATGSHLGKIERAILGF